MKISRTIAYAVLATLRLGRAEPGVPIPCSQLASEGRMPERFLLQIMRSLVNHGLLRSTRGVEGGYYLARPPEEITLRDIVDAFENPLTPSLPELDGLSPAVCERVLATLGCVSGAARSELDKLSVADLLCVSEESAGNGRPESSTRPKCEYEI